MGILQNALNSYQLTFLNPAFRTDNLSDQRSVFGRDMLQVFSSDFVFVDARERRGLGVGAEMMWAKVNSIPVVTLAPKDTIYHQSQTTILGMPVTNFIHPFVNALRDKVVETLEEGAAWIHEMYSAGMPDVKGIESIRSCMSYYVENQLENDLPMKEFFDSHKSLQ